MVRRRGPLVIAASWPGQIRGVWGDEARFFETYFRTFPGKYFTGDGARRDADGYYWITGRIDDVINVSGHRMGTAEVESALVLHQHVAEAAVVGFPHDIKGQGIYAYVTLNAGQDPSDDLRKTLVAWVRNEIGPIAAPDVIQFAPGLPKTRSGKIMRRILRKIAEGDVLVARRYLHARRSRGGGRSGGEPGAVVPFPNQGWGPNGAVDRCPTGSLPSPANAGGPAATDKMTERIAPSRLSRNWTPAFAGEDSWLRGMATNRHRLRGTHNEALPRHSIPAKECACPYCPTAGSARLRRPAA